MNKLWRSSWPVLLVLASLPALAQFSVTDLQVAARTMTFMENPLSGRIRVGIVYAPQRARSQDQARELASQLGDGLAVGNVVLLPVPVAIDQAATADVDMFLLTEGLTDSAAELTRVMRHRNLLCITTELSLVDNGACAVAIRSRPKVEIIVNREAAEASGVRFATAFRVMVTER